MKYIFILSIFMLSIQTVCSQACGIYRVKYTGTIESKTIKVEKIKLPSIQFLHATEKEFIEESYIETKLNGNKINKETTSHLTSNLYENPELLVNFYKSKRAAIPIIFVLKDSDKEILKYLNWKDIEIIRIEDTGFGNLFELNLNNIKL